MLSVAGRVLLLVAVWVSTVASLPIDNHSSAWEKSGKFQGDIVRHRSQMNKNGILNKAKYWPNRTVYYTVAKDFTTAERATIQAAVDFFNTETCVKLLERTREANYLNIVKSDWGCYSSVGMIGGPQELNLGAGCVWLSVILHEMLHAIGFEHMQSASDRDDYVTIVWRNIQAGMEGNFEKLTTAEVSSFGFKYDYGSIMHYSQDAFSWNGNPTIIPKDPNAVVGQATTLTASDKRKIQHMYGCVTS